MKQSDLEQLAALLEADWKRAIEEDRSHDALSTGLMAYFISREHENQDLQTRSLAAIWNAVGTLLHKETDEVCSFCGLGPPEARLAEGSYAFICEFCVAKLNDDFGEEGRDEAPEPISSASQSQLDSLIIAAASHHWKKVAMIIGMTLDACKSSAITVSYKQIGARIRALVKAGRLEGQGNLYAWRFSEVRLPMPED